MSSIERTPNGRWRARYRDLSDRSRSKTFDRKVDANQHLERIGADMQRGEWADPQLQKSIVATWAESWYTTTAPLKPSTRHGYRKALNRRVLPRWGERPLGSIDRAKVWAWVAELTDEGLSPRPDPQRRLGLRSGPRPRPRRPSHARQPGPRCASTEDHPGRAQLHRPVPQFVMEEGPAHLDMRVEQLGRPLEPDDWVFGNQQDPPEGLNRASFRKWVMVPALEDAGLSPKVRTHDLPCASLLISLGAHPKAIQERLGHSDIRTLNLYGHLFPSLEEQLAEALDDLGRGAGQSDPDGDDE